MNSLHFLIKYNSFKKESKLVEQSSTDVEDDAEPKQQVSDEPLLTSAVPLDSKRSPNIERKDKLKIKVKYF